MSHFKEVEFNKKIDIKIWKRIFSRITKLKKESIIMAVVNVGIAIIDLFLPIFNMYILRIFVEEKNLTNFYPAMIVLVVVYIIQALQVFWFVDIGGTLETKVIENLRNDTFTKLQKLSFSYYDTTEVGWMISRVMSDSNQIGMILAWTTFDVIWSIMFIASAFVVMLFINFKLALSLLILVPIIFFVSYYFQTRILNAYRDNRKINSKITGRINESINGIRTTKTLVREDENLKDFKVLTEEMKEANVKAVRFSSLYYPILTFISSFGLAMIIVIGGGSLKENIFDIAALALFINYLTQIFEHLRYLAQCLTEMQKVQASAERTFSLLDTVPDVVDSEQVEDIFGDAFNPKYENWPKLNGRIEFKDVEFTYKTGEKVLKKFNLIVEQGEKIALVGETGSGKSTIVNLVCRFYEPTKGEIFIDGVNYKERSQLWLHSNLGYVLQSPHLFSGTIADNVRFAKLDATDDEIIAALKLVDAYDFIQSFDEGINTEVGEGGSRLSLGQKQLISFARAIVCDPSIFILDEATSSVDTKTELTVQNAVLKVIEGRTSFIVAHRLSTIKTCDKILVIKEGEIIEAGTHQELLKQNGHYYNLYTNQFEDSNA